MTIDDLTRLVRTGEGQYLEFKNKIPDGPRFAKEVTAFANTSGGNLLIGVADDGTIVGVRDREEELFALRNVLNEFCDPPINFDIETVRISRRREVIHIKVPASKSRPHYVVQEAQRSAYVRVMDKSVEASEEAIQLMQMTDADTDVLFEFGEIEMLLMRYLDEYGKVTVEQFARMANISIEEASEKLVVLTRAGILTMHPSDRIDFFTAARSKAG